jgi:hypothetical protein
MKKLSPPFADGPSKDQHVEVESKLDNIRSAPSPASSISPVTGGQSPAANAERYFAEFTEHQQRAHQTLDRNDANGYCPKKEFVLSALRATLLRVRLIETELELAGVALKGDFISPEMALEWAEEIAPGCVGFVPATIGASA